MNLRPDLFPIRRYAQFDDLLNRTAADPLSAVFSAILPPKKSPLHCAVTIQLRPASGRRVERARRTLRRLGAMDVARRPRLAHWFACLANSPRVSARLASRLLALAIPRRPSADQQSSAAGRSHDRETLLQAAHDKLARHLFEARMRAHTASFWGWRTTAV